MQKNRQLRRFFYPKLFSCNVRFYADQAGLAEVAMELAYHLALEFYQTVNQGIQG